MKIVGSVKQMQRESEKIAKNGNTLGFVPTMGALHKGHLSLIERAVKENDIVVVSIFVNPKQFGPNEDYLRYPRPILSDKKLCSDHGVGYLFIPEVDQMYPKGYSTYVNVEKISEPLCGIFRPGHFRGVATVVLKLFNIVQPQRAYFGIKDLQQLRIIERMSRDLNLKVKIISCPIVREYTGLALSSRNQYLSEGERVHSFKLSRSLQAARDLIKFKHVTNPKKITSRIYRLIKEIPGAKIDYIEVVAADTLEPVSKIRLPAVVALAVWIGKTRLIDNIVIH